ncbi:TetR/AcrR family transcriptional regulator [Nocardioides marmoriginsengisoli]|uniref:TetR/AcrR family transcriptional regulator n=1 Tax=Nocardioides marmoriginsengisoli TaxID=661483 RepID=A0A3N0CIX2_9ACTN|nr:TetR/AcrR family transcriptional regulator [Nocardioides marmoriginsengisoli]
MSVDSTEPVPERLVNAAIKLLREQGPSAIKARTVAAECDLSTMVVYHHFGGVAELVTAVVAAGFTEFDRAFAAVPDTDDPVTDLFVMALAVRDLARANPHLYDLMFGLSTRSTYRPATETEGRLSGHSPEFRHAYAQIVDTCARLVKTGRVHPIAPEIVAAQLWSFVHGYVTLELSDHFADFTDPVAEVFLPTGVNICVGLGDDPERARASHEATGILSS